MRDIGLDEATRVAGSAGAEAALNPVPIDDVDLARAQEYALLSLLLARAPDAALVQRAYRYWRLSWHLTDA